MRSTLTDTAEDLLALSQLLGLVSPVVPLPLRDWGLSNHALNLRVRNVENCHGREDVVQTADDMSLNDLSGYVGDEGFLLDLLESSSINIIKWEGIHDD